MKQRILISGAGVTGLALAYWLNRLGLSSPSSSGRRAFGVAGTPSMFVASRLKY